MKSPPKSIKRIISADTTDETAAMTDAQYEALAFKLSLLNGPEMIPVLELLSAARIDFSRRKPLVLNVKTLEPEVTRLLATYIAEAEAPRKARGRLGRSMPSSESLTGLKKLKK
jgi:hypothetical protein